MKNRITTPPVAKAGRHTGIELLRIVSTIMVIMLHTLGCTSILSDNMGNAKGAVLWLFETICFCAVNCFALTSGYVSCQSKFKISRLVYLWLQVLFIFVVMTLAWGRIAPDKVNARAYLNMFFPVLGNLNWYFTAFFGLSMFSPFLNMLMKHLTKNQHKYLMAVIFVLFCFPTRIPTVDDLFRTSSGYSMIWLCAMYIIGGYIRIHGVPHKKNKYLWLMGFFASGVVAWLYFIVVYRVTTGIWGEPKCHRLFLNYTSPFMVLAAICLLEFFINVNPKKGSKFICKISSLTFGIFVFHTQDLYWFLVLKKSVGFVADKSVIITTLGVLGVAIGTFIICGIVTYLQMLFFKIVRLDKLCQWFQNKIYKRASDMLES